MIMRYTKGIAHIKSSIYKYQNSQISNNITHILISKVLQFDLIFEYLIWSNSNQSLFDQIQINDWFDSIKFKSNIQIFDLIQINSKAISKASGVILTKKL
jgi:hypothetical protein